MKKDIFFQLSQNAAERLAERFGTPLLVLSLEQIEKNYRFLKKHLPRVQLYDAYQGQSASADLGTAALSGLLRCCF